MTNLISDEVMKHIIQCQLNVTTTEYIESLDFYTRLAHKKKQGDRQYTIEFLLNDSTIITTFRGIQTAEMYGIAASYISNEMKDDDLIIMPQVCVFRLFGTATKILQHITVGKKYKMKCYVKQINDGWCELYLTSFKKPIEIELEVPPLYILFQRIFETINIYDVVCKQSFPIMIIRCKIKEYTNNCNMIRMIVTDPHTPVIDYPVIWNNNMLINDLLNREGEELLILCNGSKAGFSIGRCIIPGPTCSLPPLPTCDPRDTDW